MVETECHILVVGLGPAGVAAAYTAAVDGAQVIALDDNAAPGGQIARAKLGRIDPMVRGNYDDMLKLGVEVRFGRTVFDIIAGQRVAMIQGPNGVERIKYSTLILATGARELCLPFPGWTLPGVTGVGGLQALAKSGLEVGSKRIVVAGSGPLLLPVSKYFRKLGAKVSGPFEQTTMQSLIDFGTIALFADKFVDMVHYGSELLRLRPNTWIVEAMGKDRVEAVRLNNGKEIPCDYVACSFGFVPNTELARLVGCELTEEGFVKVDNLQRTNVMGVLCIGEPTGIAGHEAAIAEARIAGRVAVGTTIGLEAMTLLAQRRNGFGNAMRKHFAPRPEVLKLARDETVICRCEDVTYGRLKDQPTGRDAKLQTRCGMGPCQGRICGPAIRQVCGLDIDSVRPPVAAVPVSSLIEELVDAGT